MDGREVSIWPVYECLNCRHGTPYEKIMYQVSFRCLKCGYRIFRKVRPPIVKYLKAR